MKKLLFFTLITALLSACSGTSDNSNKETVLTQGGGEAQPVTAPELTSIQWLDSVQNFGKLTEGEKVIISFHFKNTGNKPLVITNVNASCGCTVPEKPEAPVPPGGEGVIKAEFNSAGRVGANSKYVNVTCNTETQNYSLLFEGEVLPKK